MGGKLISMLGSRVNWNSCSYLKTKRTTLKPADIFSILSLTCPSLICLAFSQGSKSATASLSGTRARLTMLLG